MPGLCIYTDMCQTLYLSKTNTSAMRDQNVAIPLTYLSSNIFAQMLGPPSYRDQCVCIEELVLGIRVDQSPRNPESRRSPSWGYRPCDLWASFVDAEAREDGVVVIVGRGGG